MTNPRRKWLRLMSLLPTLPLSAAAANLAKTAKATEGPFYPEPSMRSADIDNDLVKIEQSVNEAGGEIVYLTGVVTDTSNEPLSNLKVEIWQCDVNGRYLHTGDSSSGNSNRAERDAGFQGFGHTYTDQSGRYDFKTIKPVSYPGRTPHIHVKVFRDESVLTTQFYIKDHSENAKDGLFNRLTVDQQKSVEMDFIDLNGKNTASVNIVC